jgi:hypothetical protein
MRLFIGFKSGRTGNNLILLSNLFTAADGLAESEVVNFGLEELDVNEHALFPELHQWVLSQKASDSVVTGNRVEYISKFMGNTVTRIVNAKLNWVDVFQGRESLIQLLSAGINFDDKAINENLIHIRGGDVFSRISQFGRNKIHSDYTALPLDYYSKIINASSEEWTFLTEPRTPNWYMNLLREKFPNQRFQTGSDVRTDFQKLLSARRLAISVSSFSWAAAYLGNQKEIYFPKAGFLNPEVRPDIDLHIRARKVQVLQVEKHTWSGRRSEVKWLKKSECIAK